LIYWFEHRGMRYRIHEGDTVVGRGGASVLFIDLPSVSREHARVVRTGDCVEVTDLGSSNGTFVNGERVSGTRRLRPGDELCLGKALLVVGASESPSATTVAPAIEIIEQRAPPAEHELSTEPEFSSIEVLESLVVGRATPDDPTELAQMIKSSVDRLLDGAERRQTAISSDHRARIVGVAERVARWFPDGTLDAWAKAVARRLTG
jgi:predicted component of type VI protein secretion system